MKKFPPKLEKKIHSTKNHAKNYSDLLKYAKKEEIAKIDGV